ncbi:GTP cyclohydrolase I FolE [Microbulbifer variabilis]|uniref:GTP cyclohydrolase I FolE n=1 Tax=Microbulbifer variabilis TaxID=266805 RepID=UPI000382D3BE|nr:GTP cyclohydrolase I FolE [Microbulbifer variabilis]
MKEQFTRIIEEIGEDPKRPGLKDTPKRAAKAMKYLTRGYNQTVEDIVENAVFPFDGSEMVLVKDIELHSLCEHHLLPFIGYSHVAYIPNGKIIGISKLARIVDIFARRLQIQERLTIQIAEALQKTIDATGVGVVIEAKHTCMMMRGAQKQNSTMRTLAMLGTFRRNQAIRNEFLSLLRQ